MKLENIDNFLEKIEFIFLCILLFVIPTMESPKTIAAVLFGLTWICRKFTSKNSPFNKISLIEIPLLLMLVSSLVSTLINIPYKNQFKGLNDTILWCSIFWFIYKNNYSKKQQYISAICITSGVLLAIIWGIYETHKGVREYLEFHSAGIVTQSSIYLGIALMIPFSILATKPQGFSQAPIKSNKILWLIIFAAMIFTLVFMASRGSILAVAITLLVSILLLKKKMLFFALAILLSAAFLMAVYSPDSFKQKRFYEKTIEMARSQKLDPNDNVRVFFWKVAIERIKLGDSVLFGIGPRNFSSIKTEELQLKEPAKLPWNKLPHAHNIFLNKLVEEGIFGLFSFLFFIVIIAIELIKTRKLCSQEWIWLSAFGSLSVPIIAGSFNTPWYQEHALLAMIILGMFMSNRFGKIKQ
ncbi:MAG: O-antigen ligase family protein [Nitrospiraceae bacterium]|nr:O-antigen ligase family protein [Nitrospiraceae bacterium]